jgi:hypothetical protein
VGEAGDGISAIEGGVPIIQDGKIIGAIGISGGTPAQDGDPLRGIARQCMGAEFVGEPQVVYVHIRCCAKGSRRIRITPSES